MAHPVGKIVAAVAVFDLSRANIQHGAKNRDEHAGIVVTANLEIYQRQNFIRSAHVACSSPEESPGNSHKQSGRNPLTRNIADNETEMVVVDKKEIIKISTDLSRRNQGRIQVKLRPVRKRGKCFRHHAHLDVAGNLELAFNPL